jgi:hypothetical protein
MNILSKHNKTREKRLWVIKNLVFLKIQKIRKVKVEVNQKLGKILNQSLFQKKTLKSHIA